MNSKRFKHIIVIAVLSTFLVIGSATARTIMSYNTAYAAGWVNVSWSSSATGTIPTTQISNSIVASILKLRGWAYLM